MDPRYRRLETKFLRIAHCIFRFLQENFIIAKTYAFVVVSEIGLFS